jgi:PAS domain S-box-containing protein
MSWQFSPFAFILAVATVILAGFTLFAWQRRRTPGIIPVLVIFAAATAWSAASACSLASTDLATSLLLNDIAYPAVVSIPVAYLLFALWYTEQDLRPSRLFVSLLSVIPALSVILVWTNDLHHLYYAGFAASAGPRDSLVWTVSHGPLFWITATYSFVIVLAALILFILRYRTVGTLFRAQISLIVAAGLLPVIAMFFDILDLDPVAGFDLTSIATPVAFGISGFALIAATLNFELFSLQPLTHSLLVSTMKDGAVATSADGRITLINPAASAMFGVTEDEAVGRPLAGLAPGLDRSLSPPATPLAEGNEITLATGSPVRIVEVQAVVIPSDGGNDNGTILTIRDVTDRKNAENALRKANRQLNLLSGIVRHDIRNKLTPIFIWLDLAGSPEGGGDAMDLSRIRESAEGIGKLIDFTQEYQDLGVAAPSWQDVGDTLDDAWRQLDCRDTRLVDESRGVEVLADRLFERVIFNLLDNAHRYGGDGMTTVRVHCHETGNGLCLVCEDDGIGICADDKQRLFTKGFGKNTGLGLFLTREILSITGIAITENGMPGAGARFELTIPPGAYRFPDTGTETG